MKRSNDSAFSSGNDGMKRVRMANNGYVSTGRGNGANSPAYYDSYDGGYSQQSYGDYSGDSFSTGYAMNGGDYGGASSQFGYSSGRMGSDAQEDYYGGGNGPMGRSSSGEFGMMGGNGMGSGSMVGNTGGGYGSNYVFGEDGMGGNDPGFSMSGMSNMRMGSMPSMGNMGGMGGAGMGMAGGGMTDMSNMGGIGMGMGMGMGMGVGMGMGMEGGGGMMPMMGNMGTMTNSFGGGMSSGTFGSNSSMMSGLGPGGAELFNYRTVYMGNLPSGVTLEEVLNHVRGGTVEQAKIIEEKNCAFISFVDSTSAFAFAQEHGLGNPSERSRGNSLIVIGENQIRVGWGKPSRVANTIAESIQKGATRNVFIGNVDESVTEQMLTTEFSQFGPIDRVKIVPGKNIAFVHMASISAAVQAVDALSKDPKFEGKRLNYGKDRCNVVNQAGAAPPTEMIQPYPAQMVLNRTVYIGGVHPEATLKDLCDAVRGGMVQSVKLLSDKNVAFVTFVDPVAAVNFIQRGSLEGVAVKGKRVRVAWGKPTPPMPLQVAAAIQRENATRTLYIGLPTDMTRGNDGSNEGGEVQVNPMVETLLSEQKLRTDLADFGEIEMVNVLPQKGIGFVSFGDVASAIRAVDSANTGTGLKSVSPDYANCKVSYGKDRCAQPPRPRMFAGDDAWGQAGNSMQMGMVGMGAMNMGGMGMMPGMSMGGMNMGMGGGMGSGTMSAMAMGMSGMNSNGMGVGGGMGMGMGGGGVSSGSYRSAGGSSGSRTGNFTRRVSTSGTASTGSSAVVLVGSGAGDGSS